MKYFFAILASFILVGGVSAATPTPTATTSGTQPAEKTKQIEDLKERLATKVAELRQSQRKAIFGTVKAVSVSTITVETKTSDVKIELTDSIKVFQTIRGKRTTLTTDNVETGDMVTMFGDYDTGLDLLRAKIIVIQDEQPQRIAGMVADVDRKEFTVTVVTPEGQTFVVDIEKGTTISNYDKEKGLIKSGFSKVESGATVHVIGTPVPKKDHRISALRVIDLGNITGVTPTPTTGEEASASAEPTATPKATPKTSGTPKPTP